MSCSDALRPRSPQAESRPFITSCRAAIRSSNKQALTVACRACDPRPSEWLQSLDCSPTRYGGAKYLNNQTLRPNKRKKINHKPTNLDPGPSPILVRLVHFLQSNSLQVFMHRRASPMPVMLLAVPQACGTLRRLISAIPAANTSGDCECRCA